MFVVVAACSSGGKREAAPAATPVEKAADPWAVGDSAPSKGGNINKVVIGGDNTKPQMGLFVLKHEDAERVDAAMKQGLEPAYRLAEQISVSKWSGDRNFCEDAVRQTIGYFGIDGMMNASELRRWRDVKLADVANEHRKAINELHFEMIGEHDEAACEQTLGVYVAALQRAARDKLELRNFGY